MSIYIKIKVLEPQMEPSPYRGGGVLVYKWSLEQCFWGLFAPGRVTQGKLGLDEGPEKTRFEDFYDGVEQGLMYPALRDIRTLP